MPALKELAAGRWSRWLLWLLTPAGVVLFMASPVLRGHVPFPTDLLARTPPWAWTASPPATAPDLTRIDSLIQYAAASLPYAAGLHAGRIDLWDPYIFAGYPQYAGTASLVAPFFPTTLLFGRLFPPTVAIVLQPLVLLWLMAVTMAGFLRAEGLRPGAALLGGAAWICAVGVHSWFAMPVFQLGLWGIPALCWCGSRLVAHPGPRTAIIPALVLGVLCLGQTPNPVVYALTLSGAWTVTKVVTTRCSAPHVARVVRWGAAAGVLGMALGAVGWLPMAEMLGHVARSVRLPWSVLHENRAPLAAMMTFALPEYLGGTWPGRSLLVQSLPEVVHGIGIVGLAGLVVAWQREHRVLARFAWGVVLVCLLGAWGTPVARLLAEVPGYGTSMPTRVLQMAEWALAVLLALGADRLLAAHDRRLVVRALAGGAVLGALAVVALLAGPTIVRHLPADMQRGADAATLTRHFALGAPWWRPAWLGLGLFGFGGAIAFGLRRPALLVSVLALALLAERRWHVAYATPWAPAATLYPAVAAVRPLADAVPPVRVVNPAGMPNALKPLAVASADGYNPFIVETYIALLELGFPEADFRTYHYLQVPPYPSTVSDTLGIAGRLLPPGVEPPPSYAPHPAVRGVSVNPNAWPRALLIPEAVAVATDGDAAAALEADMGGWRDRAVVVGTLPPGERGGRGTARITLYAADEVTVEVDADDPSWLLLSDQYYPGWVATVDGEPAPILRAYLALRLVPVPAGRHTIAFRFRPPILRVALGLCAVGLLGLCVVALTARRTVVRNGAAAA